MAETNMGLSSLIVPERVVGAFRSIIEGGLEFRADIVLPYNRDFHRKPLHGAFLLVELEGAAEAILGRITSVVSQGSLVSDQGEDYLVNAVRRGMSPPENVKEGFLKYRVDMRVLGIVRLENGQPIYVPSNRRIPHVGSRVALPPDELLQWLVGHSERDPETDEQGTRIGFYALGEFVWAGGEQNFRKEAWMRLQSPTTYVRFVIRHLVSRRTFVFARAGFGKSNLVKLLFAELYRQDPRVQRQGGQKAPVGTLIFDRDGEYFFPDHKGRPGLADVPHLRDKLVIFTQRQAPKPYYGSFIAGGVKLNLGCLPPSLVVGIGLSPERQEQQNVRKLRGLSSENWAQLVRLVYERGLQTPLDEIKGLLGLQPGQTYDAEAMAALSNVHYLVQTLHDPRSRTLEKLKRALSDGKLCVVDLSLFTSETALILSGLVLQELFNHNQRKFTSPSADTIPVIAVIEEAQSVLREEKAGYGPYISWVKEGRKYDLGAVLITQQPGSISEEILSQGDNWFVFHLLSAEDLKALKRANAHYSDDILASLLNEPIEGQCVLWSSASRRPYPVSARILSFEDLYREEVHKENRQGSQYVPRLREDFPSEGDDGKDFWSSKEEHLVATLPKSKEFLDLLGKKVGYWELVNVVQGLMGQSGYDPRQKEFVDLLFRVLRRVLGPEGGNWYYDRQVKSFDFTKVDLTRIGEQP
jgi:hypothetical protein